MRGSAGDVMIVFNGEIYDFESLREDLEKDGYHFARSIWHSESIVVNTHGTAKLCLSDRASKDVKVTLAGEGVDEIYGGYAHF